MGKSAGQAEQGLDRARDLELDVVLAAVGNDLKQRVGHPLLAVAIVVLA
jgi:hypothetical protein